MPKRRSKLKPAVKIPYDDLAATTNIGDPSACAVDEPKPELPAPDGVSTVDPETTKPAQISTLAPDSKQDTVLSLLRRDHGATLDELCDVTGWQKHSVRGFLSGTVKTKLGLELASEKLEGARVYRIIDVTTLPNASADMPGSLASEAPHAL